MYYYIKMKLLIGLGNPGKEYENTRHNTGRIMIRMIEKKLDQNKTNIKFITPDNFMNSSGKAIAPLIKTKKDLKDLVVISPATSKGIVKKPKGEKAVINFILGELKKSELETLKKLSKKVTEAVEVIFAEGKDKAMSLYN